MARAYPIELRERIVAECDDDTHPAEVARMFRVSERFVYTMLRLRRETGSLEPSRAKRGPMPKLATHLDQLQALVEDQPDATLVELRDRLGVRVCVMTVENALRRLGYTLKKSPARLRTRAA